MATVTFHDSCTSVAGWVKKFGGSGSSDDTDLFTDGSAFYFDPFVGTPETVSAVAVYGQPILADGSVIPGTVQFSAKVKFNFDPDTITCDSMDQKTDIYFGATYNGPKLFTIGCLINDDGTSSGTFRRVYAGKGSADPIFFPEDSYAKSISAAVTSAEVEVVKVIDGANHYIDVYVDGVFGERFDVTSEVSVYSREITNIFIHYTGSSFYTTSRWAKVNDIELKWDLVPVESFAFDKHDVTLIKYQGETVNILVNPENAYCTSVDVYSLNENIAVPLVAGVGVGNTAIVGVFNTIDPVSLEPAQYSDMVRVTVLTNLLDTPAKPVWNGKKITWNQITNAIGYEIWIYKDGEMFASYTVNSPVTLEYDLSSFFADLEAWADNNSIITAAVRATGDYNPYYESEFSALSEIYVNGHTRKQYVQVEQCLESDPDAVINYLNSWYKVVQDLEVFAADVYTDIARTINYKNGGSVVTYGGNDYLYIMSGISDLYTDSGFTDFKPGDYRSLKPLRIRENVVSFYYYLPSPTSMTIIYPTEIKSANPMIIIDAGISLPLGALYHFKLTSYADSGAVTQIATVNSKDNPELFKYSLDERITWKAFPAGGVANTNLKLLVAARVNVGPRSEVWILPSKELVT